MINYVGMVNSMLKDLTFQRERLITEQLGDLVRQGLLVIEQTEPVLVESEDKNKIELKQSIKLVLKDKEYIERLEKRNRELGIQLEGILQEVQKYVSKE